MLDSVTKKRIDNLRNILVGKIPSPQAQVEQITTGLIYKFMHDMDEEAIQMGGVASFFAGDFEKYSWKHLFNPRLGGTDKVKLYSDAIENMYNNPSAPTLFREIFKNSFLPFKDPSTLNMFLKEINEFHYSHSEKLGDAFEYLLSFMGSQGDAGQFRTPRHIIDFIVEIINPQKDEAILDPACGTAGFLISSFKHILKENNNNLSASESKAVGDNLVGYDISPDMTRISLVNMYLHKFVSPSIHEYDTLSSEDRWNEYFDIILANPPFFSPTGGIQPHSRFGINSTRAEVLFVDYIIEHLKPNGRAGIIVPEGVIFQAGNAYKKLRKKLIESCLIGVISLPAGVFQPYSGVKTSILILDKNLSKDIETLFFYHLKNDGFSLGAKRNKIGNSELPSVKNNFDRFINGEPSEELAFSKKEILSTEDFSLNFAKYKKIKNISQYDIRPLADLVKLLDNQRKPLKKADRNKGSFPYYGATGIIDYVDDFIFNEALVLIGEDGAKWGAHENSAFIAKGKYWVNNHAHVVKPFNDIILDNYLVNILNFMDLTPYVTGVTVPKLNQANLKNIKIPVPPIEVQQEIVDELNGYQKIIDGCRQVVDNYKPLLDIHSDCEMIKIGDICDVSSSKRIFKDEYVNDGIPFYRTKEINELANDKEISLELFISQDRYDEIKRKFKVPKLGDILISAVGTIGVSWVVNSNQEFYFKDGNLLWLSEIDSEFSSEFIKYSFDALFQKEKERMISGSAYYALTIAELKKFKIPKIKIEEQMNMISEIQLQNKLVKGNKRLIEIYTQKIQDRISKVWGQSDS